MVRLNKATNGKWGTGVEGGHGSYYLRYTLDGKRKWESVGTDLRLALDECKARQALVTNGQGTSPAPVTARKAVQDAIAAYLREVKTLRGERSMSRDKWLLDLFSATVNKTYMDEITRETLFFFMAFLKNEGKSPKTIRCRLSTIETFRVKQGFPRLLMKGDLPRSTKKLKKDCYTVAEVDSLMAAADPDERFLLQFLLATGTREQEAAHTYWEDIDFKRKELRITAKPELGWTLKDFEERIVPGLPEWFMAEAKARKGTGLIFKNREGRPEGHMLHTIQSIALRAVLNCGKCVAANGVDTCATKPMCRKFGTHKFRRTFATWHNALGGVRLSVIQEWMGHSDIQTTMIYIANTEIIPGGTAEKAAQTWANFSPKISKIHVAA
jgi:integrase